MSHSTIRFGSKEETPPSARVLCRASEYWTRRVLSDALYLVDWEQRDDLADDVDATDIEASVEDGEYVIRSYVADDELLLDIVNALRFHDEIFVVDESRLNFGTTGGASYKTKGMIHMLRASGHSDDVVVDELPWLDEYIRTTIQVD